MPLTSTDTLILAAPLVERFSDRSCLLSDRGKTKIPVKGRFQNKHAMMFSHDRGQSRSKLTVAKFEVHGGKVRGHSQEVLLECLLHEALLLLSEAHHFLLWAVSYSSTCSLLQPLSKMLKCGSLCQLLLLLPQCQSHGQLGYNRGGGLI